MQLLTALYMYLLDFLNHIHVYFLMHLLRFIKRLQDFLDETSVEDKQKWDDEFHETLSSLSERSSPDLDSLLRDFCIISSSSWENRMFDMQMAFDDDLLEAEFPKVTAAVQRQTEALPKLQLNSMEVLPKPPYVKRQAQSSSLHLYMYMVY